MVPGGGTTGGTEAATGTGRGRRTGPTAASSTPMEETMHLIERDDSVLVIIDSQPSFWGNALSAEDVVGAEGAIARAAWLAATALALGVPAVLTEEDPQRNGPTAAEIMAAVGADSPVFTKSVFGLAACPDIMAAIAVTGRKTAILAGFETDVCVTHSAVGLSEAGYRVVVVADAVYSPAGAQAYGLARLRDLGVELVHCKGIYYDWVRTLEAALAFQDAHPELSEPPGFWI
jgi:nicotinamidase-related amidase